MPTSPGPPDFASTMIAPQPQKTRQKTPIASASSAPASERMSV